MKAKGASVWKRETDKRYQWQLELGRDPATGKRARKQGTCKTKREADAALRKAIVDMETGHLSARTQARLTVAQWLERWLSEYATPRVRYTTLVCYTRVIRNYITPAIGALYLVDLGESHIRKMLNDLSMRGLSPHTVRTVRANLRTALNQALKSGLIGSNPVALTDAPKVPPPRAIWTPAQAQRFLEAIKGDRYEAFYRVAISMGLRKGEALGLEWSDVDFEAGTLTVRQTLQRVKGVGLVPMPTKTDKSHRTIFIPPSIFQALRDHRQAQNIQRMACAHWATENDLVFCTTYGTGIDQSNISKHFARASQEAGLPRIRVHDMRHLAASLMIAQHVDLPVVSAILGHSSTQVTSAIYLHLYDKALKDAAADMDKFFKQTS